MKTSIKLLIGLMAVLFFVACEKPELKRKMLVKTLSAEDVTTESVTVTGEIVDLGENMTDNGFYIHTTRTPQDGLIISLGKPEDRNGFSHQFLNLNYNQPYFFVAYGYTCSE